MKENIPFLNMFTLYEPPGKTAKLLAQAAIRAAQIDPDRRWVGVELDCGAYVPLRVIKQVCKGVCQVYGLHDMEILRRFPAEQLGSMEPGELEELFVEENSMNKGSLAGAVYTWEGTKLHIQLKANGRKMLEEAIPAVRRKLRDLCDAQVEIAVEAGKDLEGQALFDAMEALRTEMINTMPKVCIPEKKMAPSAAPQSSEFFYGKPFKGAVTPMKDVNLDMGYVTIEGKVFAVEHKELKKRNAWVINFDMTDNTNSVRINKFMEAGEAKPILDNVKVGAVLKVNGKLMINQFDNEMVLKPTGMTFGSMPKRQDTAPKGKRVELHLHTTMSNMDALTPTGAAVKQAAAWGHRAIAITDHGVAQSFPDAMKAASKAKVAGTDQNIKILYGVEGYYVNDMDDRIVVHGDRDMGLDEEYVAFDLETTGLSSRDDTIIEIGAVVMKNGQETARFQTFVDPGRKLEKKTGALTTNLWPSTWKPRACPL